MKRARGAAEAATPSRRSTRVSSRVPTAVAKAQAGDVSESESDNDDELMPTIVDAQRDDDDEEDEDEDEDEEDSGAGDSVDESDEESVYSELEDEEDDGVGEEQASNDFDDDEVLFSSDIDGSDAEEEDEDEDEDEERKHDEDEEEENDSDSSLDDEAPRNTIGNVPLEWYADMPHIGYDLDGKKVMKPATGDELDTFLAKMDDPNFWRTVKDDRTGKEVQLSDKDIEMIRRMQSGDAAHVDYNPYEDAIDYYTGEVSTMPMSAAPEPKRRFVPSKWEAKRIVKMVRAIKAGLIRPPAAMQEKPEHYLMWEDTNERAGRGIAYMPAPKMRLPGHDESYNPPPEYLPSAEERKRWEETDPDERSRNLIPTAYKNLRSVPAFRPLWRERFDRCLDLYLCPRTIKRRRKRIDPNLLLPTLPKATDLRPFPSREALCFTGHTAFVRSISISPSGQWVASGSDDATLRIWEIATGRCVRIVRLGDTVHCVSWSPLAAVPIVAAVVGRIGTARVVLINARVGGPTAVAAADKFLLDGGGARAAAPLSTEAAAALAAAAEASADAGDHAGDDDDNDNDDEANKIGRVGKTANVSERAVKGSRWCRASDAEHNDGVRLVVQLQHVAKQFVWHHKGDYFATVHPKGLSRSVLVHQLSRRRSQAPFRKNIGLVQAVAFHPSLPHLYVATQQSVRIYNLQKQHLEKKLVAGVKWVSSLAIHPGGDNVIIGSYDKRLCWFDTELSTTPYKTLRYHDYAVRSVRFHPRYPLCASCSDDGTIHVLHGKVYSDLLKNPLIVPLKMLRGHEVVSKLGVLDIAFHPQQPWLISAGADATLRLFV